MDKKLNRQIDLQVSGLHVREAGEGEKSRTIEGYAVVFGGFAFNEFSDYRLHQRNGGIIFTVVKMYFFKRYILN